MSSDNLKELAANKIEHQQPPIGEDFKKYKKQSQHASVGHS